MKRCPYCAEEIQDEAIKCRWCGADLYSNEPQVREINGQKYLIAPGWDQTPSDKRWHPGERHPGIAVLLSFLFVGLGQFYNEDVKKAFVMIGIGVVGGILTLGLVYVGVWIWSMIDAAQVAGGSKDRW